MDPFLKGDLAIEFEEDQVQHKENKSSGKMSQNTMKPCINSSDENFDPTLWSHSEDTNEYRKESEEDESSTKKTKAQVKCPKIL